MQPLLNRSAHVNLQDNNGRTPLMVALRAGHLKTVQLLLDRCAQINHQDQDGNTALHVAAIEDHVDCARVLLFHPGIDVNMKNNKGHTAVMDAQKKPFACSTRWQSYVMTSLLIPMESHSACLEAISLHSPAIFFLLQDLRKDSEAITKELYYWSTMINCVCHRCPLQSSIIIVGTHADLITPEELSRKITYLKSFAKTAIRHQKLVKVLALNLTKLYRDEMDQFVNLLHKTNKGIISACPSISRMCHIMLAFLVKIPHQPVAMSLPELLAHLHADQSKLIDPDISSIVPLLEILSEKGLIAYIPSEDPFNSWIVIQKMCILKKVNGTLFADPSLQEYTQLASNTGIISKAALEMVFPEYSIEMITQFMIHFELCQVVDLSQVNTNMAPEGSSSPDLGPLLYFPALVRVDKPSNAKVPSNSFGWSMIVKSTNQFFTPRLFHVLLRRLPIVFALPTVQTSPLHSHFSRSCDVWSRGIKWLSETRVTTIVEVDEMLQSLSLTMSSPDKTDPKYPELAHAVLAVIKKACQEFCPHVEVLEVISCPPEASSDNSDDTKVELSLLKKALFEGDKRIIDISRKKHVMIETWMKIELFLPCLVGVSTSELLGHVVPKSKDPLDEECSHQHLMDIALYEFDWKSIGRRLLACEQDIADIGRDEHKEQHRRERVLEVWHQQQGSGVSYRRLIDILKLLGNGATTERLQSLATS
eukprot:Em0015g991a